mgnify:FL=1
MKKLFFAALIGIMLFQAGSITTKAENIPSESTPADFYTADVEEWFDSEGSYTYPITPSDPIWHEMSYGEWVAACNMPQEVVDTLSTEELINAALDYPLKMDYMFFNSYSAGIQHLQEKSNVYRELFEREDAPEALLTAYESLQVDYVILNSAEKQTSLEDSGYDRELVLQLLLASNEIYNQMDEIQVTNLTEIIDEKCEKLSTTSLFYNVRSEDQRSTSDHLNVENIQEDIAVNRSATTFRFERTSSSLGISEEKALYYIGLGHLYGKSPSCWMFYDGDYTPVEAGAINGSYLGKYTTWVHKSGVTKKYNCHSYCWIKKSYDNIYWLNDPTDYAGATTYFRYDGRDIKVTRSDAYIILYDASGIPLHSVRSVTTSSGSNLTEWKKTLKVESKLGTAGVYETTLQDMFDIYGASYYKVYYRK